MAIGSADTVRTGIAAPDHHHMLALGAERAARRGFFFGIAGDALILLGEKIHGEMDARQFAVLHRQVARRFRPARQHDRVIIGQQHFHRNTNTDFDAGAERHAFRFHLADAAVNQMLFHFKVGNAVAQQAADAVAFFKQSDVMAGAGQLLGTGHARRARADHGNGLAGFLGRNDRLDPAFFPGTVHDLAFDGFDGDRSFLDVQGTARLARGGADAAGEFGEIVGGVQILCRRAPLVAIDQIVPVGNLVIDRAALVTKGNAAIHAARRLLADIGIGQRVDEFAVILKPLLGLVIAPVLPLDFQKACDLTHDYSAATALARAAFMLARAAA